MLLLPLLRLLLLLWFCLLHVRICCKCCCVQRCLCSDRQQRGKVLQRVPGQAAG
jgi:hypothetical protein